MTATAELTTQVLEGAACSTLPWEMFITEGRQACQEAAAVCHGCPVRPECLQRALSFPPGELYGIWGGYALHNSKGRCAARSWLETNGYAIPEVVTARRRAHNLSLRQEEPSEPDDFRACWPEQSPLD